MDDMLHKLRLSESVGRQIKQAAKQRGVSMNAEMASRLEASFTDQIATVQYKSTNCTFCGKNAREVRLLITAPASAICNECVELCVEVCTFQGVAISTS
jgi:hypothetical protein